MASVTNKQILEAIEGLGDRLSSVETEVQTLKEKSKNYSTGTGESGGSDVPAYGTHKKDFMEQVREENEIAKKRAREALKRRDAERARARKDAEARGPFDDVQSKEDAWDEVKETKVGSSKLSYKHRNRDGVSETSIHITDGGENGLLNFASNPFGALFDYNGPTIFDKAIRNSNPRMPWTTVLTERKRSPQ